jgi:hypothetical protein
MVEEFVRARSDGDLSQLGRASSYSCFRRGTGETRLVCCAVSTMEVWRRRVKVDQPAGCGTQLHGRTRELVREVSGKGAVLAALLRHCDSRLVLPLERLLPWPGSS